MVAILPSNYNLSLYLYINLTMRSSSSGGTADFDSVG